MSAGSGATNNRHDRMTSKTLGSRRPTTAGATHTRQLPQQSRRPHLGVAQPRVHPTHDRADLGIDLQRLTAQLQSVMIWTPDRLNSYGGQLLDDAAFTQHVRLCSAVQCVVWFWFWFWFWFWIWFWFWFRISVGLGCRLMFV